MERIQVVISRYVNFTLLVWCWGCSSLTDQPILRLSLEEQYLLANYSLLEAPHHLQIAPRKEPGTPLIIIGKLLRAGDGVALPNREILVYQADYVGKYEPGTGGDESGTRLKGTLISDKEGRFQLSTILPGNSPPYGTPQIHLRVREADPQDYAFFFKQFMSSELIYWAKEETEQAMVVNLRKDKMGRLVGIRDIIVETL